MPYADPEKKRQYMAAYNKKWYQANKEPKDLVSKAVDRKKELRSKKRRWLVDNLGGKCVVTGSDNGLNLEVYLKTPSDRQSWGPVGGKTHPKSVYDYSWSDLYNIYTLPIYSSTHPSAHPCTHPSIHR